MKIKKNEDNKYFISLKLEDEVREIVFESKDQAVFVKEYIEDIEEGYKEEIEDLNREVEELSYRG